MTNRVKIARLLTTAAMVIYPASQASAQESSMAPDAESGGLEEIIVTARKRDENIQDVPASISALSAGELERRFDSDVRNFAGAYGLRHSTEGLHIGFCIAWLCDPFGVLGGGILIRSRSFATIIIPSLRDLIAAIKNLEARG